MSIKLYRIFYLFLFLLLQDIIKSEGIEDNKYSFELYNSHDNDNPNFFYAQTHKNLIIINSTEGDDNTIIENKISSEYLYSDISSVSLIDEKYLVKTCFGPDNLMKVQYKNKETYIFEKNNFSKIKFCYSSKIKNPKITATNPEEYVLITYWTEIDTITDRERYSHKCILFYPSSKKFSQEIVLTSESKLVINIYYPEKCTTFRDEDIYCGIHFSPSDDDEYHIIGNQYIIETDKIYANPSIYVVISNSVLTSTNYQRPLALGKTISIPVIGGYGDIYMTEFHNYNQNGNGKTLLLYSYYIRKLRNNYIRKAYVPYFEAISLFYGLNIEDKYIHQDLFNHLVPNKDELIIIYISKETHSLLLSRFDINNSKSKLIHKNFKDISNYNYIRTDICNEPKYLQSVYINSFINYENSDKITMNNNINEKYYKYQRDIGVLISCDNNNNIIYQSKKIEIPQCLDTLDELNGNNKHKLTFEEGQREIIFDLYGDPNLISLRNVIVNFNTSILFSILIQMQVKLEGESTFRDLKYDLDYKKVTHIKFIKKYTLLIKEPLILPYRLKQNKIIKNNILSQLESDVCKLEFSLENNHGKTCEIDLCIICKTQTICEKCNNNILGLIEDKNENSETYGKCICNENNGFKKMPNKAYNRCVCKDNYSYYLDINQCKPNNELDDKYIIDTDPITGIDIYGDCYKTCKKCSKAGTEDAHNCDQCKNGLIMIGNKCFDFVKDTEYTEYISHETQSKLTDITTVGVEDIIDDNDVCLNDNKIWFQLGQYIFYYAKIGKCIFIYDGDELFFISSRNECKNLGNNEKYINEYISNCLNNNELNNKEKYFTFIENAKEYNPNSNNITIYKYIEEEKKYFHLYNSSINIRNISSLYFDEDLKMDLLIFKVDIKRNDTISTQVEYQFYNPIPEKIYEKIDIYKYLSKKRRLQNDNTNTNNNEYVYLDIPVSFKPEKLEKIEELYKADIDPFNSSSEFYLDVCNKYTTPSNDDIYLQDRKKEYYPDEPFCEENCEFIKFNLDTEKITCKCSPKTNTDNFENITFKYNDKDEKFKKKFISPNLKAMKCGSIIAKTLNQNFGFFFSFFILILFILLFIYRILKGKKNILEELENLKKKIIDEKTVPVPEPVPVVTEPVPKPEPEPVPEPEISDKLKESDIKSNTDIHSIKLSDSNQSLVSKDKVIKYDSGSKGVKDNINDNNKGNNDNNLNEEKGSNESNAENDPQEDEKENSSQNSDSNKSNLIDKDKSENKPSIITVKRNQNDEDENNSNNDDNKNSEMTKIKAMTIKIVKMKIIAH